MTDRRKAPIARHADGRINGRKLAQRIHMFRMQGLTLPQIAQRLDLPLHNVHCHMRPPEEYGLTAGMTRLIVLAAELRLNPAAVRSTLRTLDLPSTPYGRHLMLTEATVQALRAHYIGYVDQHTAKTWWTIEQVARALHKCTDTVRKGINEGREPYNQIRRARVHAQVGNSWRYDPHSVHPLTSALPVLPVTPPRGSLTAREVAEVLGLQPETVNAWAQRYPDAPARRTQHGRYYWPHADLVAWLLARPAPHMRSYGRTLTEKRAA